MYYRCQVERNSASKIGRGPWKSWRSFRIMWLRFPLEGSMNVGDTHYRTIWVKKGDSRTIQIIDQSKLPFRFEIKDLHTLEDVAEAIKDMYVRGAGLIGATAGYGMYIAAVNARAEHFERDMQQAAEILLATRPTAKNLEWAVSEQLRTMNAYSDYREKVAALLERAEAIADEDARFCKHIGEHGVKLIEQISARKEGEAVNILTHCNAGWLAFVDYGSATAPIYTAFDRGIPVHVWVDETRPRNQGASLTAWELASHGVPHHLIVDNAGGHLMQHGMVDLVIVGADRVTVTGDAANKIGTYLKALAAHDNQVPFYVALPSSTFDWTLHDGVGGIPIEERNQQEVTYMIGEDNSGNVRKVRICPPETEAKNYGFDVTPARLISGIITERGICEANKTSITSLFEDKVSSR